MVAMSRWGACRFVVIKVYNPIPACLPARDLSPVRAWPSWHNDGFDFRASSFSFRPSCSIFGLFITRLMALDSISMV